MSQWGIEVYADAQIEKLNVQELLKKAGLENDGSVQVFHTQNVLRRIEKYMPYRTGAFIKLMIAQSPITTPQITVDTPFAHVLYRGETSSGRELNYTTTKNSLAGPNWDARLMDAEGDAMQSDLQSFIDRKLEVTL